jgi:hypothetical protein
MRVFCVLLAFGVGSACTTAQQSRRPVDTLRAALKENPGDWGQRLALARALQSDGAYKEAIDLLNPEAIGNRARTVPIEAQLLLADIYTDSSRLKQAQASLLKNFGKSTDLKITERERIRKLFLRVTKLLLANSEPENLHRFARPLLERAAHLFLINDDRTEWLQAFEERIKKLSQAGYDSEVVALGNSLLNGQMEPMEAHFEIGLCALARPSSQRASTPIVAKALERYLNGATTPSDRALLELKAARRFADKYVARRALRHLEEALRLDSDLQEARLLQIRLLFQINHADAARAAIAEYLQRFESGPQQLKALGELIPVLVKFNKHGDAIELALKESMKTDLKTNPTYLLSSLRLATTAAKSRKDRDRLVAHIESLSDTAQRAEDRHSLTKLLIRLNAHNEAFQLLSNDCRGTDDETTLTCLALAANLKKKRKVKRFAKLLMRPNSTTSVASEAIVILGSFGYNKTAQKLASVLMKRSDAPWQLYRDELSRLIDSGSDEDDLETFLDRNAAGITERFPSEMIALLLEQNKHLRLAGQWYRKAAEASTSTVHQSKNLLAALRLQQQLNTNTDEVFADELSMVLDTSTQDIENLRLILDLCGSTASLQTIRKDTLSHLAAMDSLDSDGYLELGGLYLDAKELEAAGSALSVALASSPTPSKRMKDLFALFHQKGNIGVFLEVFNSAKPELREDGLLIMHAASILSRRAEPRVAETLYRMSIQASFDQAPLLRQLGKTLEQRSQLTLALESFNRAQVLEPSPRAGKSIIRLHLKLHNPQEAFALAKIYAEEAEDAFDSWNELGQLFTRQFYFKKAIDCYMRAFALRANDPPRPLLRTLLHLQKRFGTTKQLVPLVAQLVPRDKILMASERDLMIVVDALISAGHIKEALYYEKTRANSRERDPVRWLSLASIQLKADRDVDAIKSFEAAYKATPKDEKHAVLKESVFMLAAQDRNDLALKLTELLSTQFSEDLAIRIMKSHILFEQGQFEAGQKHMLEALNKISDPQKDWPLVARIYTEKIPANLRTDFVAAALKLFPGHPSIARELGLLRLSEGKLPQAIEAFEQIKVTQPDQAFHIGRILMDKGHWEQAYPFYRTSALLVREDTARQILPEYLRLTRSLFGVKATRRALGEIMSSRGKQGWLLRAAGLAYIEAGMLDEAQRLIQKSIAQNGVDESEKLLGIVAYWSGNKLQAKEHFEAFAAPRGGGESGARSNDQLKSVDRHLEVAQFLSNEGDFTEALEWTRKCFVLPGGRIKALVSEAFHALRANQPETARIAFSNALNDNPARALMASDNLLELALRSQQGCTLLPAIAGLPKDIGPIAIYAQYRLGLACYGRAEEALGNLLLIADAGIPEIPAFAGFAALRSGNYREAEQLLTAYIQKWGARILSREGKSGEEALLNLLTAINMQDKGEIALPKMRAILDLLWRDAQQPLKTLEHLSKLLGGSYGQWDLAAEFSDKILSIKSHDNKLWMSRVDIALQRSHKDLFAVLERLRDAGGPKEKALLQIRNVWLETGELQSLNKVRSILNLEIQAESAPELFRRFEEAFLALDLPRARSLAEQLIETSKGSLIYYHKLIGVTARAGWLSLARPLLTEARQKFPLDATLFWWFTKDRLTSEPGRKEIVESLSTWIQKHGHHPIGAGNGGTPDAIDLYHDLSLDEFSSIIEVLVQKDQSPELPLFRALLALKMKNEKALLKEIKEIDDSGLQSEQLLNLLFKESVRGHFINAALDIARRIRKWTGLLPASQRLCFELENLLVNTDVNDPLRRTIGAVGLKIMEDYLLVANDSVGSTTNLASFKSAIGDHDGAVGAFQHLIKGLPGLASTQNNFAYHYAIRGTSVPQGLSLVERALKLEPAGSPFYLDTRAWLLYHGGRFEQAYQDVLGSIRTGARLRNFSSEESQIHAAEIALKRGDQKSAAKHALRAVLIAPRGSIRTRAKALLRPLFSEGEKSY